MDRVSPQAHATLDTLPALFAASITRFADRPAMEFLGRRWTYAELDTLVDRATRGLQRHGATRGTKVALCLPNSPYFIIYFYAVLRAGGIVVPCNPLYVERELQHQISDAGAAIVVTIDVPEIFDKVATVAGPCGLRHVVVCALADALPPVKRVLYRALKRRQIAPRRAGPLFLRHADIMADTTPPEPVAVAPDDIAVLQYTGGTTGVPKGAMLTHVGLATNAAQVLAHDPSIRPGLERFLVVLPLFHVFALTALLNNGLLAGAELILQPRFVLDDLLRAIERQQPTVFAGVPTLYAAINKASLTRTLNLRSLTLCISGGAPLPAEVRERFVALSGCKLVEGYGLTECCGVACCNPPNGVIKDGSIGVPMTGTTIELRDPAPPHDRVPPGERGEICIRGPQVMAGYWQQPEATASVMVAGALRTGDIGTMDADGYVYVVDRLKELILCSGYNVYPSVIEAALYRHPAVAEAMVVAVPDAYRGQAPLACVTLQPGAEVTQAALRDHLAQQISKIEMPRDIIIRDSLPRTAIGKLSKKDLLAELAAKAPPAPA